MLSLSELKIGTFVILNRQPHQLIWHEHSKLGRGGAILRTKFRNLLTGAILDTTLKGNEKFEEAVISRERVQFTYKDAVGLPAVATTLQAGYHFMNLKNFEQFSLPLKQVGEAGLYLRENSEVDIISWNGQPININPPIKVELKVTETEPAVRGNTAQGAVTKPATLETGKVVQVPIFIRTGDIIRVNTETGAYVERLGTS